MFSRNATRQDVIGASSLITAIVASAAFVIVQTLRAPVPVVTLSAASVPTAPAPSHLGLSWATSGADDATREAFEAAEVLSDQDVVFLYQSLTNGDVSDAWTASREHREAKNEFERKRIDEATRTKLEAKWAKVRSAGAIVKTNVSVGSYDFRRKAFPLQHGGKQRGMEAFVRYEDASTSGEAALEAFSQRMTRGLSRPTTKLGAFVDFDNAEDADLFRTWIPVEEAKAEQIAQGFVPFREMGQDVHGFVAYVLFAPARADTNESAPDGVAFAQKQIYGTAKRVLLATEDGQVAWVSAPPSVPEGSLLARASGVGELAVDDAFVYWTGKGGVWRVPKSGGDPTRIAASDATALDLRIGDARVAWVESGGAGVDVKSAPKDGAGKTLTLAHLAGIAGFASDGANAYYGEQRSAKCDRPIDRVVRVPLAGGAEKVVAGGQRCPHGLSTDPLGALYWVSSKARGQDVLRVGKSGGDLGARMHWDAVVETASDATYVFASGGSAVRRATTTLPEGSTATSEATIAEGLKAPASLKVSGRDVLWLERQRLVTVPIEGGDPRQVVTQVVAFALDDTSLFLAARDGRILRLPRASRGLSVEGSNAGTPPALAGATTAAVEGAGAKL